MRSGLQVRIGGRTYSGFEEISVTRTIEAAAGSFTARFSTKVPWPFLPGAEVQVLLGEEPVADGFIDRVSPELSTGGRKFSIEGRDRTGDLVDCAAFMTPSLGNRFDLLIGEWFNTPLQRIVAEICKPYGVTVIPWGIVVDPFTTFSLQPGETAWEAIERACRLRGVLAFSDGAGSLILARPATVRESVGLEEGVNVLSAEATIDHSERFAEYVVRGQSFGTDEAAGELAAQAEGRARDPQIRAQRRLVVIAEGSVADGTAEARAQWEATVRAARSAKVSVRVQDWRQPGQEKLWGPNQLVPVTLPSLGIAGDMLISSVAFSLSRSAGTTTALELVRRDAFLPQPDISAEDDPFADLVEASS